MIDHKIPEDLCQEFFQKISDRPYSMGAGGAKDSEVLSQQGGNAMQSNRVETV
jgi:hypothetical protein